MKVPCKDCKKRKHGCHSICEDYKVFKKECNYANKKLREDSFLRRYK